MQLKVFSTKIKCNNYIKLNSKNFKQHQAKNTKTTQTRFTKKLSTCFLTATHKQKVKGARKTGPTVKTEQPLLSTTLIHSVSSPSRALMGTNLTWRCLPLRTTRRCSSLMYSNWKIFLPSPTLAISEIFILLNINHILPQRKHFNNSLLKCNAFLVI